MDTNGHLSALAPSRRLLRRLDDVRTADTLERLNNRLDLLSFAVDASDGLFRRGGQLTDNISDASHEARAAAHAFDPAAFTGNLPQLAAAGVRLAASPAFARLLDSGLLDRLAAPETLASLQSQLDKLPLLTFAADAVDDFLRRGEEVAENVADSRQEAKHFSPPIDPNKLQQARTALINATLLELE